MSVLERDYQAALIRKLKVMFPGCVIQKGDSSSKQGIPDLIILYKNKWATLEVKRSGTAAHRPNQDYYVQKFNDMSFCRFIYPENEQEVLNELQNAFRS